MCPNFNCSQIRASACINISPLRGHCLTQTGLEVNHVKGRGEIRTVAPIKKGVSPIFIPHWESSSPPHR